MICAFTAVDTNCGRDGDHCSFIKSLICSKYGRYNGLISSVLSSQFGRAHFQSENSFLFIPNIVSAINVPNPITISLLSPYGSSYSFNPYPLYLVYPFTMQISFALYTITKAQKRTITDTICFDMLFTEQNTQCIT